MIEDIRTTTPSGWHMDKNVSIEIIGGGESDGLYLDGQDQDQATAELILTLYRLTEGGKIGSAIAGASIGELMGRLADGGKSSKLAKGGQPHFYQVIAREEDGNNLLLRFCHIAGRTEFEPDYDGTLPEPDWVNKALHKFVSLNIIELSKNRLMEYWIAQEILQKYAMAIDRSIIENHYRQGPLREKCEAVITNIRTDLKADADYKIAGELIYFMPRPK
jgi:hypothetical protein